MVNLLGIFGTFYTLGGMFIFLLNGNANNYFALFAMCTGFIFMVLYVIAGDKETKQEIEQRNRNKYL